MQNSPVQTKHISTNTPPQDYPYSPSTKSLEGLGPQQYDPAAIQQLNMQANWAYQQIMSGQASQELQNWYYNDYMAFAQANPQYFGQMGGTNWGPNGQPGQQGLPPDAFGGIEGANGNYVYNEETAEFGFVGSEVPRDVYANDVTSNVAQTSVQVTVELVMDTSIEPPEEVIKVTYYDPATGVTQIDRYHDWKDLELKINTPGGKNVTFLNGTDLLTNEETDDPIITVGEFKKQKPGEANSKNPQADEVNKNGEYEYVSDGSEVFDFYPDGEPVDNAADAKTSIVWGDGNIYVPGGHYAEVSKGQNANDEDITIVTIKDKDGKVINTYKFQMGYGVSIKVKPEYLTFLDDQGNEISAEPGEVPAEFEDTVGIGEAAPGAGSTASAGSGQEVIEALVDFTGKSEEEIIDAITSAGYDIKDFPPEDPAELFKGNALELLRNLDPDFNELYLEMNQAYKNKDMEDMKDIAPDFHDQLLELFGTLYKGKNITDEGAADNGYVGNFFISGQKIMWAWWDNLHIVAVGE